MKTSLKTIVIKYYPNAICKNVGCKGNNGNYYEIWSNSNYLGKGKSKEAAWKSAYRNLD